MPAPQLSLTLCPQDNIRDKLRPIAVVLSYDIKLARSKRQAPGAALPPLPPVLSAQQPSIQRAQVHLSFQPAPTSSQPCQGLGGAGS